MLLASRWACALFSERQSHATAKPGTLLTDPRTLLQAKKANPDRKGEWRKMAGEGYEKLTDEEKLDWHSKAAMFEERRKKKQKAFAESQSQVN